MANKKDERARVWTIIVYPESAPEKWKEIINDKHISWACILHDKDVNPDGSKKKPHYHVVLVFEGKKSFSQIKAIADELKAPIPQKVESLRGMMRYLIHMDNPEKYQYDKSSIIAHSGAEIDHYISATTSERYELIAEMMDFIDGNNITEIEDMLLYARKERFMDWFPLLCDNSAYVIGQYIKSKRHRQKSD